MAEVATEQVEVNKTKRSLGKILLLGINVLLFVTGAAFFLLTKSGIISHPLANSAPTSSPPAVQDKPNAAPPPGPQVPQGELVAVRMQPLVINLSGDRGRRFLRLRLQLEVYGDKAEKAIDDHQAQIRDHLILLLSSKTFDDINTVQGKYQLREEISKGINDTLGAPLVAKIYFTEFIVQ